MSKLTDFVFAQFAAWEQDERPGDPGYFVKTEGRLYGGGELGSDLGFQRLQVITDKACDRFPNDPLASGRKMEMLRFLFDEIPRDWPQTRRLLLTGSIIRYMAELD